MNGTSATTTALDADMAALLRAKPEVPGRRCVEIGANADNQEWAGFIARAQVGGYEEERL